VGGLHGENCRGGHLKNCMASRLEWERGDASIELSCSNHWQHATRPVDSSIGTDNFRVLPQREFRHPRPAINRPSNVAAKNTRIMAQVKASSA